MKDISDEILTEISYVEISTYRTRVMKAMLEGSQFPSQIARDADIVQSHISNVLRKLKDHELVECINPEVKRGRVYKLTDKGMEVAKNLNILNISK
ncbi:MAG: winged helix-turn-helix transcriptional regulator [Methanobrevibacter sp.]|uniref:winged helix-turn-helix domain-containing protein n=1 Tax=Methanobrevibacter sp. TaxID=66852 RepID=UPI0025DC90A8|nr:winged helix-turn-helix domain-containing protein [Methanobrevibacter sp.]MBQ8016792.1 winged helix-turn-helix transcriptional regulator [Methanobrevibacter sp.]